jgi:hemerythrin-like domain-containing protein
MAAASDLLRADHRKIEDLIDQLLATARALGRERPSKLRDILALLQPLVAAHFAKEEKVLYPRLRSELPDLLARMDEQHEHAREIQKALGETLESVQDRSAERELSELRRFAIELHDALQHHIVEEEDQLLRLADERVGVAEQDRLAEEMSRIPPG